MKRSAIQGLLALAVAVLSSLLATGCCHCSDARLPDHPQRPGDVVRVLRDAIGDRQWAAAAECFSDEVRQRDGEAMRSGDFEWPIKPRDVLVGIELKDNEALATLEGPKVLTLKKNEQDRWHIASWR